LTVDGLACPSRDVDNPRGVLPMAANEKEQFDVLYESLRTFQTGFVDAAFKATASFLLVLGWLVTSDKAREFLLKDPSRRYLAVLAVILAGVIYASISIRVYKFSHRTCALLDDLGFVPRSYYEDRILTREGLVIFISANALLVTALSLFLLLPS
jgi:hypothetical protein